VSSFHQAFQTKMPSQCLIYDGSFTWAFLRQTTAKPTLPHPLIILNECSFILMSGESRTNNCPSAYVLHILLVEGTSMGQTFHLLVVTGVSDWSRLVQTLTLGSNCTNRSSKQHDFPISHHTAHPLPNQNDDSSACVTEVGKLVQCSSCRIRAAVLGVSSTIPPDSMAWLSWAVGVSESVCNFVALT
jgi:hypothetical protein